MRRAILISAILAIFAQYADGRTFRPANAELNSRDITLMSEAYHLHKTIGSRIWPGWSELQAPMVYITNENEFAINFSKTPTGFEPAGDTRFNGIQVYRRGRTFAPNLAASFYVDGSAAVVIGTPEGIGRSNAHWVLTAIHEMFHVYQSARGFDDKVKTLQIGSETDAMWQLNYPFPYTNENVMRGLQLQGYLTYLAINDADPVSTRITAGNVMDAVNVYHHLLDQADASLKFYDYSRFQEMKEGIALYTEYKAAELAMKDGVASTAAYNKLPERESYTELWDATYKGKINLVKFTGRVAKSRTVFYPLGLGKGLLLDKIKPDWKSLYFAPNIWLDDIFARS